MDEALSREGGHAATPRFHLNTAEAEAVFINLLNRRDAIRDEPGYDLDNSGFRARFAIQTVWIDYCRTAYAWQTRTPLALLLCGLLARATSPVADPLSIQEGSGDYGYNAAGLWSEVIMKHGNGRMNLRKLKNVPLNNSPFNGKRRLATDWENVSAPSVRAIRDLHNMLTEVESMNPAQAENAFLSLLLAAPDPDLSSERVALKRDFAYPLLVPLTEFADDVARFITLNSDDGRRAQAFVTACIEVAFPGHASTPRSINDPSRSSPGDVRTSNGGEPGTVFVEVKDKLTRVSAVETFLREVLEFDPQASAGYAALSNTPAAESALPPKDRIPSASDLTRAHGLPVVVWKSPLELLSQTITWSGLPVSTVIWLCARNYLIWLEHLDTGKNNSPVEWQERLDAWGFLDESNCTS